MNKKSILILIIISVIFIGGCSSDKLGTNTSLPFTLTVTQEGEGKVTTDKNNQTVTLLPVADKGWVFDDWQGDNGDEVEFDNETQNYKIKLDEDKVIKAVFVREKYNLNINYEGEGSVTKEKLAMLNDSSYENGSMIRITAQADEGWEFSSWKGDINSTENPEEIVINEEKNITVEFKELASLSGNINVDYDFSSVENNTVSTQSLESVNKVNKNETETDNNEMIIGFKENLNKKDREKIINDIGGKMIKYNDILNAALVEVDNVENKMLNAQSQKGVRYTEPNHQVQAHGVKTPNDPLYSSQWNHRMIDSSFTWSQITDSGNIRVAVLDTGIDSNHIDLEGRIDYENGYNFVSDTTDSSDDNGHGTHVAGIIGALSNNYIGITGTTWKGEILPVKVLDQNGSGSYFDVAEGILYAAGLSSDPSNQEAVDVINLSLGGPEPGDNTLHDAIKEARNEGLIIVASSGNDYESQLSYPAYFPETIAVGAVNSTGERAAYSNYGPNLDVVAPGGSEYYGVLSTVPGDEYEAINGTSMAGPHVSGLISLMLANGVPSDEVRDLLHKSSINPTSGDFSEEHGYGLINSNFAINQTKKLKVIVGNREDDKINKVAETTVPLAGGSYNFPEVPKGSYHLYAWIDANNDDVINSGDYIKESDKIDFKPGKDYQKDLRLLLK